MGSSEIGWGLSIFRYGDALAGRQVKRDDSRAPKKISPAVPEKNGGLADALVGRDTVGGEMHPLLAHPWVAAQIDAAVAPYLKLWPPAAVEAARDEMAETLLRSSVGTALLRRAGALPMGDSGDIYLDGGRVVSAPPAASAGQGAPRGGRHGSGMR